MTDEPNEQKQWDSRKYLPRSESTASKPIYVLQGGETTMLYESFKPTTKIEPDGTFLLNKGTSEEKRYKIEQDLPNRLIVTEVPKTE